MKTIRTARTARSFRTIAAFVAFAGSVIVAAPHANAATAQFGQCDFGTPSITNFSCMDSDDIEVTAGPAHTDNGPLSDKLDIDWYQNESNFRIARINGDLRLEPGNVGTATMRISCVNANGAEQAGAKTVTIATANGLHLGLNKNAAFTCRGQNLQKVRVAIHYVDALGRVFDDSHAREYGDAN